MHSLASRWEWRIAFIGVKVGVWEWRIAFIGVKVGVWEWRIAFIGVKWSEGVEDCESGLETVCFCIC